MFDLGLESNRRIRIMQLENYFYNASKEYIETISPNLFLYISEILKSLPGKETQRELNEAILIQLAKQGWSFDTAPNSLNFLRDNNDRSLCLTSSTLGTGWHSDFAKAFDKKLVQIEVQFGKVETMFKDFCGFRIAYFEKRLSLGVEVVMLEPNKYFSHRKESITGMAYFDVAKRTLPSIGLDCPIWLIGIG